MTKFYEVPFYDKESSFYIVFGNSVGLYFEGQLHRTLMTLAYCEELVRLNLATAHA